MKTILLIDCNALVYSAYYMMGNLSYNGNPTGVIYGFLKKILFLAHHFQTNDFYLCWDSPSSTGYRAKIYPEYKGNRRKNQTEEEKEERIIMYKQGAELRKKILPALGFKNFYKEGLESDDLLAFWAFYSVFKGQNKRIIMVTSDTDMYQCLECCSIYNPATNKLFTKKDFISKYKIEPIKWALAKAIGGCSSDNVKGINGAADPKSETSKALKYIRGELTEGKIFNKIKNNRKMVTRNLRLVLLPFQTDEPWRLIPRRNRFNRKAFLKIFDKYRFISFLEKEGFQKWKIFFGDKNA